jgi:hypothetical protein
MLSDPSHALPREIIHVLRIDTKHTPDEAKMAFLLMVEKLQLSTDGSIRVRLIYFRAALRRPSYPSAENVRLTFRQLYRCVARWGDDEELDRVERIAQIMGEPRPYHRRRPSEWECLREVPRDVLVVL